MTGGFDFATATELVFGRGRSAELGQRVRAFGRRALLVTGAHPERVRPVLERSGLAEVVVASVAIRTEPTTAEVERGVLMAREAGAEVVVGVGGGSALDAAKAIGVLATNPGEPLDYLEVVGRGKPLTLPSLPCVLVPTTAGTGAEVTKNAVLAVESERVKVSLRSLFMLPRLALVDSELTHGVPPDVTAATGLDALTQLIEPYVSKARGPLTDALGVEGMRRSARSLRRAFADGSDAEARDDLALASLFGGLCLANAKLGAVHGLAGPLGGALHAPHGALCARLLPEVMDKNLAHARALRDLELLERFGAIARILCGRSDAEAEAGLLWIRELVEALRVPRLAHYGLTREGSDDIVERARVSSSMKGNPVELGKDELCDILERAS
jgi:alcohol dehydrogenase class IV